MRSLHEDILNISSHARVPQHLITFVNHEEFALTEVYEFPFGQVSQSSWS